MGGLNKDATVLEIGCGTGNRLGYLADKFGLVASAGIEPSLKGVSEARNKFPDIEFLVGTADDLSALKRTFDIVIFGFCLYLCDRKDLYKIAYEADNKLNTNGLLVIYDFYTDTPYKNRYRNEANLFSYKQDYSALFDFALVPTFGEEVFSVDGAYISVSYQDTLQMVSKLKKLPIDDAYWKTHMNKESYAMCVGFTQSSTDVIATSISNRFKLDWLGEINDDQYFKKEVKIVGIYINYAQVFLKT